MVGKDGHDFGFEDGVTTGLFALEGQLRGEPGRYVHARFPETADGTESGILDVTRRNKVLGLLFVAQLFPPSFVNLDSCTVSRVVADLLRRIIALPSRAGHHFGAREDYPIERKISSARVMRQLGATRRKDPPEYRGNYLRCRQQPLPEERDRRAVILCLGDREQFVFYERREVMIGVADCNQTGVHASMLERGQHALGSRVRHQVIAVAMEHQHWRHVGRYIADRLARL